MEYKAVVANAMWLRDAMIEEHGELHKAKETRHEYVRAVSVAAYDAHTAGHIDGKNSEQRKLQLEAFLRNDDTCQKLYITAANADADAALATIERQYRQEHIKLVRAWLYQEAGTVITL